MQRPNLRFMTWYFVYTTLIAKQKDSKLFFFAIFHFSPNMAALIFRLCIKIALTRLNWWNIKKILTRKLWMSCPWYLKHCVKRLWHNSQNWVLHELSTNASISRLAQRVLGVRWESNSRFDQLQWQTVQWYSETRWSHGFKRDPMLALNCADQMC